MGSDTDSSFGQENGDIPGHKNKVDLHAISKIPSWLQSERSAVTGFKNNSPEEITGRLSPPDLRTMVARNSTDANYASLPKTEADDAASNFQSLNPRLSDNAKISDNQHHPLQNTQSMPVWMPSVVATTISEDAEEQVLEKMGDISLHKLRDDVDKAYSPPNNKLSATKSLNSVSSPDAAHRLPYNNDTQRREKKNTENSNIRNAGNKISHRKKKRLMKKLTRVQDDGTLAFDVDESSRIAEGVFAPEARGPAEDEYLEDEDDGIWEQIPSLKVVMLIVGTRGDVQPFLAIGRKMQVLSLRSFVNLLTS